MKALFLKPVSAVLFIVLLGLAAAATIPAAAQQTAALPANQDEINKLLLKRLQELEDEVKELRAERAAATPRTTAATEPTPVPTPTPAPAPASVSIAAEVNEVAPRLKMEVFGDVAAQKYTHVPDTFLFGSLDLFMTSRLSNKVSALGEALFIAESDNSVSVDVERLILKYQFNEHFVASMGRYHTWVGYYNTAYNKAEFLETPIDRPFVYAFDDQGGVLPMQDVGVNLTGKIPSGRLRLNYLVEVGNGRAWGLNVEPGQNNQDANNSKSINGGLFIRPADLVGSQFGFSLRHDNLTVPGSAVGETIATAHAVLNNGVWEILNEGVLVRHVEATGPVFSTSAFYTQLSRSFKDFRPYFRYQYFNAPSNDPVYAYAGPNEFVPYNVTTFVGRLNGPSIGLRYNFTENSAFKVQYDRYALRGLPTQNGVTTQVAFSF
jgi:hypothetical protein